MVTDVKVQHPEQQHHNEDTRHNYNHHSDREA